LCGGLSARHSAFCEKCGFPAVASGADIERARSLGSVSAFLSERYRIEAESASVSPWAKVGYVVAGAILLVAAALARFAPSLSLNVLGITLLCLALAGIWAISAGTRKGKSE
jgi:hypothetical protein